MDLLCYKSLNEMGTCFGKPKWCAHTDYNYCGSQGGDYGKYPSVMGCGNLVDSGANQRYCFFHDEKSVHKLTIHQDEYYLYLKDNYPDRIRCSCIADERRTQTN